MSLGKQRAAIDEEMSAEDQRAYEQFIGLYDQSMRNLAEGEIVKGRVVTITNNSVVIDVGYKSEGLIPVAEPNKIISNPKTRIRSRPPPQPGSLSNPNR